MSPASESVGLKPQSGEMFIDNGIPISITSELSEMLGISLNSEK
jgi:hypothetical protein